MALTLGSVTIAADGTPSGSGMALRIYQKRAAATASTMPGGVLPSGAAGAKIKQGIALFANADAEAFYEELTLNAQAKIAAGTGGLQRQDDPMQDTTGPTVDKFLPIV